MPNKKFNLLNIFYKIYQIVLYSKFVSKLRYRYIFEKHLSTASTPYFVDNDSKLFLSDLFFKQKRISFEVCPNTNDKYLSLKIQTYGILSIPYKFNILRDMILQIELSCNSLKPSQVKVKVFELEDHKISIFDYTSDIAQSNDWTILHFDLNIFEGKQISIELMFLAPLNDKIDVCFYMSKFILASSEKIELARSLDNYQQRIINENRHFAEVYEHKMYNQAKNLQNNSTFNGQFTSGTIESMPELEIIEPLKDFQLVKVKPCKDVDVYHFAHNLLTKNLKVTTIDFQSRLNSLSKNKKLKVLSICSGAGRTEINLAKNSVNSIDWTFMDVNENLLGKLSRAFKSEKLPDPNLILMDLNNLSRTKSKWDIIICVSGLHHLVQLENLFKWINSALVGNGELWVIGEYVGRNGNRLWPEAYTLANEIFAQFPDKYRYNNHTKEIDRIIPPNDYSCGTFEGIRSESILKIMYQYFKPVDQTLINCFLWRLTNLAYSDNYNLTQEEDLNVIELLVKAEITHFLDGGRGTELNGIYQKQIIAY
jgi:ubiquinone/menaquinone biosynthesis C-methylase UbiE